MTLRDALAAMVEKYRMLAELHAGEPGRTLARRDAIRKVADRFPAAMREFDELPPEEIARRGAEAEALLADHDAGGARAAAPEHAWIRMAADLHERLRAALAVKRWLAGRAVDDRLAADAAARFAVDRATLDAIASPDEGRWTDRVYRETAAAHGVTVERLKAALFGER